MNRDHFIVFETVPKYCISDSFVDYEGTPFLLRDSCPQQQKKWSSELNSPITVHFNSLIPKMSMFTLAISYLTTSNLPRFMDLTFQVPMQYCSLQHRTLLLSPVTSTTGCCFFSVAPSLHSFWSYFSTYLQQDIGHLLTWRVHLSVSYFLDSSQNSNSELRIQIQIDQIHHRDNLQPNVALDLGFFIPWTLVKYILSGWHIF